MLFVCLLLLLFVLFVVCCLFLLLVWQEMGWNTHLRFNKIFLQPPLLFLSLKKRRFHSKPNYTSLSLLLLLLPVPSLLPLSPFACSSKKKSFRNGQIWKLKVDSLFVWKGCFRFSLFCSNLSLFLCCKIVLVPLFLSRKFFFSLFSLFFSFLSFFSFSLLCHFVSSSSLFCSFILSFVIPFPVLLFFVIVLLLCCYSSSLLLLSLCVTKKKMDEEKQYPNKETKKLFEGAENGDEEVVKVLLLGNKNKQFKLDINFKFKEKVFSFQTQFLSLSLSFQVQRQGFSSLSPLFSLFFF